jgi:hypothetical protein
MNPNSLSIDHSYSYRAERGYLEGELTVKQAVYQAKNKAQALWGELPTLLIEPSLVGKSIPKWTHMVWAEGPATDETKDASELVIIWFSEFPPDTDRILPVIDWEKHAKDFNY